MNVWLTLVLKLLAQRGVCWSLAGSVAAVTAHLAPHPSRATSALLALSVVTCGAVAVVAVICRYKVAVRRIDADRQKARAEARLAELVQFSEAELLRKSGDHPGLSADFTRLWAALSRHRAVTKDGSGLTDHDHRDLYGGSGEK